MEEQKKNSETVENEENIEKTEGNEIVIAYLDDGAIYISCLTDWFSWTKRKEVLK